jgi:hypothetical protein
MMSRKRGYVAKGSGGFQTIELQPLGALDASERLDVFSCSEFAVRLSRKLTITIRAYQQVRVTSSVTPRRNAFGWRTRNQESRTIGSALAARQKQKSPSFP